VQKNAQGIAEEITVVTRRQNAGGNRGGNAATFTGRFDSYGTTANNRATITTQVAQTVVVPADVPVLINGRRVTLRELRDGDQITVTLNQNTGLGSRVVVNSRR
jgi:hypothetical protein